MPETILLANGSVGTVMLDERYTPYEEQAPRIENLCGSFTEHVSYPELKGVLLHTHNQFGRLCEVYSIHGNVTVNQGKGSFMGAGSMDGLEKLARALKLSHAGNTVHMAVICGKMGKRVQVSSSGLLETKLRQFAGNVRVEGRMYDHTNTVRMHVTKFADSGVFELEKAYRPDKNDWTITGRGNVMIRFSWKKLRWTHESEAACMAFCARVIDSCL